MKAFGIYPAFDLIDYEATDSRYVACIELISKIVLEALQQGGDYFYYAVDWRNPEASPLTGVWENGIANPHIIELTNSEHLRSIIRQCLDPSEPVRTTIRSIATCRAVKFGYDGQAFLCLRHEDPNPTSPDSTLVDVENWSDCISKSDLFDGWLPEAEDES